MQLVGGCQPREPRSGYVARVGDSFLTTDEIENDSTRKSSAAMIRQEAARWVNNELLFQEARRQGLENSEKVQRQVREARKQLSIEALLQKEIYGDTIHIAEDSISTYFKSHPEEFLLREDVVLVSLVAFTDRGKANSFRAKIFRGAQWDSVLSTFENDTAAQKSISSSTSAKYYTQQTLFPAELWRVAMNLPSGETSFPVRTQGAFVVIQTHAKFRHGTGAPLDLVRNEIRQRLTINARRQRYAELIAHLRSQYEVEITVP